MIDRLEPDIVQANCDMRLKGHDVPGADQAARAYRNAQAAQPQRADSRPTEIGEYSWRALTSGRARSRAHAYVPDGLSG
jgi:hypothetical protein